MGLEIDKEKCKNLIVGVLGIYIIYCAASVLQQWMYMEEPYINRFTGEQQYFKNSNAFVLVPSLISWVFGSILNRNNHERTVIPKKNLFFCAALVLGSGLSLTAAIYITSFPMVMMIKSCNVLSVLLVGIFCSRVKDKNQKIGGKKLITGVFITMGILLYNFMGDKEQTEKATQPLGIVFLLISLLCDGFLPDFQAQVKVNFKPTPMEMFQDINRWKTYLSAIYCLVTFEFMYMGQFFYASPWCLVHLVILGSTGSIGQMIVYWMIKLFKQHIVPFTITTRKLATVLISILFFGHSTTLFQFLGIILVFTVVIIDFTYEIMGEKDKENKIINPSDNKAQEQSIIKTEQSEEIRINSQMFESREQTRI